MVSNFVTFLKLSGLVRNYSSNLVSPHNNLNSPGSYAFAYIRVGMQWVALKVCCHRMSLCDLMIKKVQETGIVCIHHTADSFYAYTSISQVALLAALAAMY